MLVQRGCADLTQSNGIPLSFQDVLHFIVHFVLIIKSQIACKILRDHPVLNVLTDHLTVYVFSKDLINLDQTGKILPASGCCKDLSIYRRLHPVKIVSPDLKICQNRRMNICPVCIFFPYIIIHIYIDLLDSIQCYHIKIPYRLIVLRRITCRYNDPSCRNLLITKCLTL